MFLTFHAMFSLTLNERRKNVFSKHYSYSQEQQTYLSARNIHKEWFHCTNLLDPDAWASTDKTQHYLHALKIKSGIRTGKEITFYFYFFPGMV